MPQGPQRHRRRPVVPGVALALALMAAQGWPPAPVLAGEPVPAGGDATGAATVTDDPVGTTFLGRPVHWVWPRFSTAEWVSTGAFAALAISAQFIPPRDEPLRGGWLADETVRDAVALGSLNDQRAVRDMSDVLLSLITAYPYLVDALVVTAWYRESRDAAWQMTLINAQTMAITVGVQSLVKALTSRERPFGRTCGGLRSETWRDCDSNNRYHSFFSGHAAGAFASAGLICSHHVHLKLYGGGAPDVAACAASYAVAAAIGAMRVAGDQHYLSDVLVGAAVGTVAGLGVPWLLHYRHTPRARDRGEPHLSVQLVPMGAGAGLTGVF